MYSIINPYLSPQSRLLRLWDIDFRQLSFMRAKTVVSHSQKVGLSFYWHKPEALEKSLLLNRAYVLTWPAAIFV